MINISERPKETDDRAIPGHWEDDLILGSTASPLGAIGTLVERTTGRGPVAPARGPHPRPPGRRDVDQDPRHPEILRRSLTWGPGSEMALHTKITEATGLPIYFCDPHSPWQRGTNENTNGLLRQYSPKAPTCRSTAPAGSTRSPPNLQRPTPKRLNWRTPAEELDRLLSDPSIRCSDRLNPSNTERPWRRNRWGAPMILAELVAPAHTAIVTQGCRVRWSARTPFWRRWPRRRPGGAYPTSPGCCRWRAARVPVVHCLVQRRADGPIPTTTPSCSRSARHFDRDGPSSEGRHVVAPGRSQRIWCYGASMAWGRWAAPTSTPSCATSGCGPSWRSGVSLNVAIPNLVMDAVNAAYAEVVLPRDAVAGIPTDYGQAIIDKPLALLSTVTTIDALIEAWS